MKTPEEIKKALECCSQRDKCPVCPYYGEDWCSSNKNVAALALIRQLEAENAELKRELDAAKQDMKEIAQDNDYQICAYCKKYPFFCSECEEYSGFEWRGPCEENGGPKEEEK